jgi:hypothetical protein
MGERRDVYRVLVRKPQGKSQLGKTTRRQEDNIKMGVQEVEWGALTEFLWLRMGMGGALW